MLSSYGSTRAYPTYANLGSGKAAAEAWVRYMAAEFGPRGINVNGVTGGLIDSVLASVLLPPSRARRRCPPR